MLLGVVEDSQAENKAGQVVCLIFPGWWGSCKGTLSKLYCRTKLGDHKQFYQVCEKEVPVCRFHLLRPSAEDPKHSAAIQYQRISSWGRWGPQFLRKASSDHCSPRALVIQAFFQLFEGTLGFVLSFHSQQPLQASLHQQHCEVTIKIMISLELELQLGRERDPFLAQTDKGNVQIKNFSSQSQIHPGLSWRLERKFIMMVWGCLYFRAVWNFPSHFSRNRNIWKKYILKALKVAMEFIVT